MAKYHVNPKTGAPGLCRALSGQCPFGSSDAHKESAAEAVAAFEHSMGSAVAKPLSKTGEWDRSGEEPRWVQAREQLLADALTSWVGSPADMQIHMSDVAAKAPVGAMSGSGRIRRAQAEALYEELENSLPLPKRLYRGSSADDLSSSPTSWSEDRKVAEHWATKAGGQVRVLEPGQARGVRMADYLTSGADEVEKQWLVVELAH